MLTFFLAALPSGSSFSVAFFTGLADTALHLPSLFLFLFLAA